MSMHKQISGELPQTDIYEFTNVARPSICMADEVT